MKQYDWQRVLGTPTEQFHEHIQSVLYALPEQEEMTMKKTWSIKRVGLLAAAAVMVLTIGVAAVNELGFIRTDWHNTRELADASAVMEVLESGEAEGISADAKFLENYSNGFTFVKGTLEGMEAAADGDPTVYHYQSVSSRYERNGATVYVYIDPLLPGVSDMPNGTPEAFGDVTLYTLVQDYLVVPEGYEKTPEQAAAESDGTLMFSYSDALDAPEAMQQRHVTWVQDGMRYSVYAMDSMTELDELVEMAKELINS